MDMKSTCPCPNLIGSLMGDPDTRYSSTEAAKTPFLNASMPILSIMNPIRYRRELVL
jgi:hypothetical protein